MSKTAHLPFRLQPFASVGVQNIWGHKWGHFANLQAIMIINSIIYGEISNPTLSANISSRIHEMGLTGPENPQLPRGFAVRARTSETGMAAQIGL